MSAATCSSAGGTSLVFTSNHFAGSPMTADFVENWFSFRKSASAAPSAAGSASESSGGNEYSASRLASGRLPAPDTSAAMIDRSPIARPNTLLYRNAFKGRSRVLVPSAAVRSAAQAPTGSSIAPAAPGLIRAAPQLL